MIDATQLSSIFDVIQILLSPAQKEGLYLFVPCFQSEAISSNFVARWAGPRSYED